MKYYQVNVVVEFAERVQASSQEEAESLVRNMNWDDISKSSDVFAELDDDQTED